MKVSRLSNAAFDVALAQTRMRSIAIEAARAVLVHGSTRVDAARQCGLTRGRVGAAVNTIVKAYLCQVGDGEAEITVEIKAPERVARALDEFAQSIKSGNNPQHVEQVLKALAGGRQGRTKI